MPPPPPPKPFEFRTMILEKGQHHKTKQMFREAGETWPVIIPEEEIHLVLY